MSETISEAGFEQLIAPLQQKLDTFVSRLAEIYPGFVFNFIRVNFNNLDDPTHRPFILHLSDDEISLDCERGEFPEGRNVIMVINWERNGGKKIQLFQGMEKEMTDLFEKGGVLMLGSNGHVSAKDFEALNKEGFQQVVLALGYNIEKLKKGIKIPERGRILLMINLEKALIIELTTDNIENSNGKLVEAANSFLDKLIELIEEQDRANREMELKIQLAQRGKINGQIN